MPESRRKRKDNGVVEMNKTGIMMKCVCGHTKSAHHDCPVCKKYDMYYCMSVNEDGFSCECVKFREAGF